MYLLVLHTIYMLLLVQLLLILGNSQFLFIFRAEEGYCTLDYSTEIFSLSSPTGQTSSYVYHWNVTRDFSHNFVYKFFSPNLSTTTQKRKQYP